MARHNELGNEGEWEAMGLLARKGYRLHHRNWRVGHLEIDIVAEWYGVYVFVEVKTRKNKDFSDPIEAVDEEKKRNIIAAANAYMRYHNLDNGVRFDIITVIGEARPFEVKHYRNAFVPREHHV